MIKAKPWHGKWCSRSVADKMNDFLNSLVAPNRTNLMKESDEFEAWIKEEKEKTISAGETW